MDNTNKRCPVCDRLLPKTAFAQDKNTKSGLRAYCRACCAARLAAYAKETPSEKAERKDMRQQKRDEYRTGVEARTAERAAAAQAEISRRKSEGKVCYACGAHKPPTEYRRNRSKPDGMQGQCTECMVAQSAAARAKDPEKYRAHANAAARTRNLRPEVRAQRLAAKRGKNLDKLASKTEHYWHYVQWRRHCARWFFEALDPTPHDAHVRAYPKKERARRQKAMRYPETHHAHVAEYRRMSKRSHLVTRTDVHNNLYVTFKGWLRKRLRHTLAGHGFSWGKLFPYTQECVARHLESRFLPGMRWHNRTDWHIDHIRPIAAFEIPSADSAAFAACFALENLQPLWAIDNIKKGAHSTL